MNKVSKLSHNWLIVQINNNIINKVLSNMNGIVVDLGCGTAPYKPDILKVATKYVGVDWKNSLHEQSHVDIFADLCKRLPIDDSFADTVVSFQVLEHLPEPYLCLEEAYRILKGGGKIIITVPFMWQVHEAPHDFYRFTRHGLFYLLSKAGFVDVCIKENTGFWQTVILKLNYYTSSIFYKPLRVVFIPFWYVGQQIAPFLDKLRRVPSETASYTVVARKP